MGLFDLKINDVYIWERIRFETFREILYKKDVWTLAHSHVDKNVGNILRGLLLCAKNLVKRNPYFSSNHKYLFWGHERRKYQDDGKWWDIFCDPIYESLDLDYLHFEVPHDNRHLTPAKTENIRYLDLVEYSSTIERELGLTNYTLTPNEKIQLQNVRTKLLERFGVDVDIEERVGFRLTLRKSLKPKYKRVLDRVDPEIVFTVPSLLRHTFIEVCKDQSRPVIELQHGVLTEYEYGYPNNRKKRTAPDYFFTWGDFWNDKVDLPVASDRVRSVGYPYFEKRKKEYRCVSDSGKVVFISQGNIGRKLSKFAVRLSKHPNFDTSRLVYKLHPGEYDRWESDYPWLTDIDFSVIGEGGPGLYELFSKSSVQVGVYSTAIFEGLGFGLQTYLINLPGVSILSELTDDGYAELITSPDDLVRLLEDQSENGIDTEQFFKSNPIENFSEELDKIRCEQGL